MSLINPALQAVVPILPALSTLFAIVLSALLAAVAALMKPGGFYRLLRLLWAQKLPLSVIAFTAIAIIQASKWIVDGRPTGNQAHSIPVGSWPMIRGGIHRMGSIVGERGPQRAGRNWSGAAEYSFYASPAVAGDRVYCVGSRGDRGRIFCWEQKSGRLIWSSSPDGYRATFSSPVVAGRYLFCGEGYHKTPNSRVVCLDTADGSLQWSFTTSSHVECTPIVVGDRLYVAAGDDGIYCLHIDPNRDDRTRLVWRAPGDRYPDAETSLAVHEGRVYVGLGSGGNALAILDAKSGQEIGRIAMSFPVFSPPAVVGDRLYVGMGNGNYINPAGDPAGRVSCIDLERLKVAWSFDPQATVLGAIAVDRGEVIFCCADGRLYVVDTSGRLVRSWDSGAPIVTAPCLTAGHIYSVSENGQLTCLDRRWLQPVWGQRLGRPGRYFSSPVAAGGRIFVGTESEGFLCVGQSLRVDADRWVGRLAGPGRAGVGDASAIPATAIQLWKYAPENPEPAGNSGPVAITSDEIVIPRTAGMAGQVICLDNRGSDPPVERWRHATAHGVHQSAAIVGNAVFAVDGLQGDANRHLRSLRRADGHVVWMRPLAADASGVFLANEDSIYIQEQADRLARIRIDNTPLWSKSLGRIEHAPHPVAGVVAVAASEPAALALLDKGTGRLLWRVPLDLPPTGSPTVLSSKLFVPTKNRLEIRSLIDGHLATAIAESAGINALYVDPDRFYGTTADGELFVGLSESGTLLRRISGCVPGANPLAAVNGLLLHQGQRLMRIPVAGNGPQQVWYDDPKQEVIGRHLLLHGGRVYVAAPTGGLICLGRSSTP